LLANRIERQENDDPSIVSVPRLTIEERKEMLRDFLEKFNLLENAELLMFVEKENGRTNLDFGDLLPIDQCKVWREFKSQFVETKIESFSNLQNIDLNSATLWTDKKMTSVTFDLIDRSKKNISPKPWWKIW
jgi:hypothetical protein